MEWQDTVFLAFASNWALVIFSVGCHFRSSILISLVGFIEKVDHAVRWEQLRTVGDQRVLQVSYVVFALIPIWAGVVYTWEQFADSTDARIEMAVDRIGVTTDGVKEEVTALREDLAGLKRVVTLGAIDDSKDLGDDGFSGSKNNGEWGAGSELGGGPREAAGGEKDMLSDSAELAAVSPSDSESTEDEDGKYFLHLSISRETKCLWFSMLMISLANLIYSICCPEILQRNHRASKNQSSFTREFDFKRDMIAQVYENNTISAEIAGRHLVDLITSELPRGKRALPKPDAEMTAEDEVDFYLRYVWETLNKSRVFSRLLIAASYFVGAILFLLWLVERIGLILDA